MSWKYTHPISDAEIRNLTQYQRDLLIDHIDAEVDVNTRDPHMVGVRNSLMRIGMLKGSTPGTIRPRATVLTERGRMAVGMVLGQYADALARTGLVDRDALLEGLRRLKVAKPAVSGPDALKPARLALKALQK